MEGNYDVTQNVLRLRQHLQHEGEETSKSTVINYSHSSILSKSAVLLFRSTLPYREVVTYCNDKVKVTVTMLPALRQDLGAEL
jgi:hypothetical protein